MAKVTVCVAILYWAVTGFAQVIQPAILRGIVVDSSGLVIPGAAVKVQRGNSPVTAVNTSAAGEFTAPLPPGDYTIEVTADGFSTYSQTVHLAPQLPRLTIALQLAPLTQTLNVTENANQISLDADSALQTTILQKETVDALPDDADSLVNYLSQIAGSRGEAGADAVFIIDGFTDGHMPAKEQIQEIRINNNPFSSEFSGLGLGRTEIITKSGTGAYHGTANFLFRDAALNARNPFALTRPPYQQKNFNASVSGPLIRNRLSFNLDLRDNVNELSDAVHATLPSGVFSQAIVMPNINRSINARGQWALTSSNTLTFNVDYQRTANNNQGIGGFTLPERAWNRKATNRLIQIRETAILSPKWIHEFRLGFRRDYSSTVPVTDAISINVSDAFNAGGSQNQNINDNRSVEFSNLLMYSGSKWSVRTGAQVLRRLNGNVNYNNFAGVYTFSNLAGYLEGTPATFTQNLGNPFLDDVQWEFGTFLQVEWHATPHFVLSPGARYEAQTNITDHNNLDPRFAFAYQVGNTTAVRGGLGMFHQRMVQNITDQLLRFDGQHQVQIVLDNPPFPNPYAEGSIDTPSLVVLRLRSPNLTTPYSMTSDVTLEKSLPKGIGLTVALDSSRAVHLYRSRNINQPSPGTLVRPDSSIGNRYLLESTGRSWSSNWTVGIRQTLHNRSNLNLFGNYTFGRVYNDTDGPFSLPASTYDLRAEWGRSPGDLRHRFVAGTNFNAVWNVNVNLNVQANSNRPYNITTGYDDSHDGTLAARPTGTSRNTGVGPAYFNMNASIQKIVVLSGESSGGGARPSRRTLSFIANLWNALNNTQFQNYSGVLTSPSFGKPSRANNPRNIEVGTRFSF